MAVALPLNHLVTDYNQPNRTPSDILKGNLSRLGWKSYAYSALQIICYVALLAIIATVFAISYNLIAMTGVMPLAMAGLFLSTPLLILAPSKLAQNARYCSLAAENESDVYWKYREIENWTTPQIEQFMTEKGLQTNRIPLDALRSINPNEPLQALLPLIAGFKSVEQKVNRMRSDASVAPQGLEEIFRNQEAELGHPIEASIKQKRRFETKNTYEMLLETTTIPIAFQAAVLLQIMQNPTDVELDISPTFELPRVGTCAPRNFAERQFGKHFAPRNDDYFIFHPDLHREPISHQAIEDNQMNPSALRLLLFPSAVRV